MEKETPKLEFFSDIKDKFFLILGGIVSLTTFIPAFLNKIAEIFGWHSIAGGYYSFVAIYFIFPFIFYLLYCGIHDYVGFLELLPDSFLNWLKNRQWVMYVIEITVAWLVIVYLVCPVPGLNEWVSLCVIVFSLFCFGWFLFNYAGNRSLRPLVTEFVIIGSVIILIFSLFFKNVFQNGQKNQLFSYSMTEQSKAFDAYDTSDTLKKYYIDVLDSTRASAYKYSMEASVLPAPVAGTDKKRPDTTECDLQTLYLIVRQMEDANLSKDMLYRNAKSFKHAFCKFQAGEDSLIKLNNGDIGKVSQLGRTAFYLYDYAQAVQKEKSEPVTEKWAKLLKDLQYKSLVWFLFLIIMSLCLWFKMQIKLKAIPNKKYSAITPLIIDNSSQVKSLIFLLFVLVIPWFRSIDKKTVQLDRPFLNLSLKGLVNGEYLSGPSVSNEYNAGDVTFNPIFNKFPVNDYKHDEMLDVINANIKKSLELTREHAQRTIGSVLDRRIFNEPKKTK